MASLKGQVVRIDSARALMGVLTLFLGFRLFGRKAPAHTENFALAIFVEPDDRVPVLWRGVVVGWSEHFAPWLGVELGCNLLMLAKRWKRPHVQEGYQEPINGYYAIPGSYGVSRESEPR